MGSCERLCRGRRAVLGALLLAVTMTGACATSPAPRAAGVPADGRTLATRDSVLAAVQGFFDAMAANDPAAMRAVMLDDGQYYATAEGDAGFTIRRVRHEDFFRQLVPGAPVWVERMWDPTVLVHERIAMVWTPYDIHRDGVFSHCGIDIFSLIRTERGWQIAGIVYTVEPEPREPALRAQCLARRR
jgi:hypothetical protein